MRMDTFLLKEDGMLIVRYLLEKVKIVNIYLKGGKGMRALKKCLYGVNLPIRNNYKKYSCNYRKIH